MCRCAFKHSFVHSKRSFSCNQATLISDSHYAVHWNQRGPAWELGVLQSCHGSGAAKRRLNYPQLWFKFALWKNIHDRQNPIATMHLHTLDNVIFFKREEKRGFSWLSYLSHFDSNYALGICFSNKSFIRQR